MNYYYAIALFIISFTLSGWFTWYLIKYLNAKHIIDNPGARSNHNIPKPRGGGIATVIIFSLIYPLFSYLAFNEYYYASILALLVTTLGVVGFIDDIKSINVLPRFIAQIIIVALMLFLLFPKSNLLLPLTFSYVMDKLLLVLLVTYFVNIYNFMDGIDGITASNTIAIMIGTLAIIISNNLALESVLYLNIIITACSLAFLLFNWHPSKIFYGDVGSLVLGLLTAFSLLKITYAGYFWPALLIAGYYLFDATLTIIRRLITGEKIWQAHSKHFYQLAVRKGYTHSQIVIVISIINIILILVALFYLPKISLPLLHSW